MKKFFSITLSLLLLVLLFNVQAFADTADPDTDPPESSNIEAPEEDTNDGTKEQVQVNDTTDTQVDSENGSNIINPFDIKVTVGTQNAFNKSVPIWIVVTPKIDAERAEVSWDSRYGLNFKTHFEQFTKMNKGESYTLKTTVMPEEPGSYTLTVNVNEWGYGRNYTSSEDIPLKFNEDLVTDPLTEGYERSVIISYAIIGVVSITIIVILIFVGKKALKWLKEWLKPPEF